MTFEHFQKLVDMMFVPDGAYKINKNGERSLIFYAGLLMILKDVEDWFENDKAGNI
ncbi:MAG: hypothetical protein IIV09_03455 [Selenomonadaceae bacterium]|nr:hypothetical protein [Selenomonadaceae bacterium]